MNPFKWLWDKYRHKVNQLPGPQPFDRTERVKRQLEAELAAKLGNPVLEELARSDRASRIVPGATNSGRSIRG